jgi:hypothetical protein
VLSRGTGFVDAHLADLMLTISGQFRNLETDFNPAAAGGAHLHNALAGQNGGIAIPITPTLDVDNRGGTFEASNNTVQIDSTQLASLQSRALYANIHTTGWPGGELRGQLVPANAEAFKALLSGSGQVPAKTSLGKGMVIVELVDTTLTVSGSLSGLGSDFNPAAAGGAHLHSGLAGQEGGAVVFLEPTPGSDNRSLTFAAGDNVFEVEPEVAEAIRARGMYANIHTVDDPGGEIRGQVIDAGSTPFLADLSGANAEPANASTGRGAVLTELNDTTLWVSGSFEQLRDAFNPAIAGGAHLHSGLAGQGGGIAFGLASVRAADELSGIFEAAANVFGANSATVDALFGRGYYANIHTNYQRSGELRGQLLPAWSVPLRAILSGRAEVSHNTSQATGATILEISGSKLTVSGAFNNLQSGFNEAVGGTGAHIHDGGLGENGGIAIGLTATRTPDDLNGTFQAGNNVFDITEDQRNNLLTLLNYVNIHTDTIPSGELRGQIHPFAYRPFEANLSFANEVGQSAGKDHAHHGHHTVQAGHSNASGAVLAVLGDTALIVSGTFKDLSSAVNTTIAGGAHLHLAAANANGGIDFRLTPALAVDSLSGSFPAAENTLAIEPEQKDNLLNALYYANVHTRDHAGGELRGQLVPSGNVAPNNPAITAPEDGSTVVIAGDTDTPFAPTWNGGDRNANPVFYTWQLAADETFSTLLLEAKTDAPVFASTFGAVNVLLDSAGVDIDQSATLYHRAVATDGNFIVTGAPASVTLTRGQVTATDDPGALPEAFRLRGNFPNPFNPSTTVAFDLPATADVEVTIHDILGREVLHVPARTFAAGAGQSILIDASSLASGMYLYRVQAASVDDVHVSSGRMVLIK